MIKHHTDHKLNSSEIRLMQAYLRVLDCYGDYDNIRGIDVIDGRLNQRTRDAIKNFADRYGIHDTQPTTGLLQIIKAEHMRHYQTVAGKQLTWYEADRTKETEYGLLQMKFDAAHNIPANIKKYLGQLHPEMRFPAWAAIKELKEKYGIRVNIAETLRTSESQQEAHVMHGASTAPPGYSFHCFRLAMDISPDNGRWKTMFDVMERYGFYSLYRHQGWDQPHHELPAKTRQMVSWPTGPNGWKEIPDSYIPHKWREINQRILRQSAVTAALEPEITPPSLPRPARPQLRA